MKKNKKDAKPEVQKTKNVRQENNRNQGTLQKLRIKMPQSKLFSFGIKILVWFLIFFITLIIVDYAVQYINYRSSAAIVNGEKISQKDFYNKLQDIYGEGISEAMIEEVLIYQEAEKRNISISDDDLDKRIRDLQQAAGGKDKFDEMLKQNADTEDEFREKTRLSMTIEKIIGDIEVTDDDKQQYYETYKGTLFTPEGETLAYEDVEDSIEVWLKEEKFDQEYQKWIADVKKNSVIVNNIKNPKDIEFLGVTRSFIKELMDKEEK
ncbi:SurA N-terminal domain-containing protein [Candidatus Dojkabacteria bacterium]|nr:SurA N-terminal domain-containing protein [Candidatus Dojkabacteria bacterium]